MDDISNMRSLTLGDAERDAMNALLANYVEMTIPLADIQRPVGVSLNP